MAVQGDAEVTSNSVVPAPRGPRRLQCSRDAIRWPGRLSAIEGSQGVRSEGVDGVAANRSTCARTSRIEIICMHRLSPHGAKLRPS